MSLRRDRRVTVKDVDLCEPHHNLDSCGRVRSINGVHTHAGINRPRDKQEKGEGRNTTQMILRSPFSCDLLRRDRRVTVPDVDLCEPPAPQTSRLMRSCSINQPRSHSRRINRPEINRSREKGGTNTNDPPFSILLCVSPPRSPRDSAGS